MASRHLLVAASIGILSACFMLVMFTGCGSGGHALPSYGCPASFGRGGFSLVGTVTGLVGVGLTLDAEPSPFAGFPSVFSNGPMELGEVNCNAPWTVTVHTQPVDPAQTCVIANGSGPGGTSNVDNIVVTCTINPPRFAYVVNRGSNNVTAFAIDAATGTLAAIAGSPFGVGHEPVAIAVDQTGSYAYVVNQTDATISAFLIDRSTGALNAVTGSPFATGSSPTSVAIDPSSPTLYVTNSGAGTVSVYAITAGSGALVPVTGSPYSIGGSPTAVVVSPGDSYSVYVADPSAGTVSLYAPPSLGTLAILGAPMNIRVGPLSMAVDNANLLYVADAAANALFGISGTDTLPTATAGSPYSTGTMPTSVAIDPLDNFVYVANQGSNNISAYALGADGSLTALPGSPFAAADEPAAVAVDPTGSFLYVANAGADNVSVFAIDATTGALSEVMGSPYAAGTQPTASAISD
jgi:6-phosphogluconolactonase (cycloisomerase 2 family)